MNSTGPWQIQGEKQKQGEKKKWFTKKKTRAGADEEVLKKRVGWRRVGVGPVPKKLKTRKTRGPRKGNRISSWVRKRRLPKRKNTLVIS